MAHEEASAQIFTIPDETLQLAMSEELVSGLSPQFNPNLAPKSRARQEEPRKRHTLAKIAAGAALTSALFLGGEQQSHAEIAPADTMSAQPASEESNSNGWVVNASFIVAAAGVVTTTLLSARSISRQTRESTENRFAAALQGIKGESSGEERVLRLGDLYTYADRKKYAPKVFRAALTYLRGRRGGLEILRKQYSEDPAGLEHAITERRNADREALKLLTQTLPAMRKQLRGASLAIRLKRLFGGDEHYKLDKQTGALPAADAPFVNARGLNIDYMRGVKGYSFRDTDLTGAGMQGNQFSSVIFRNTRLCEAQFEGSTLYRCSLRKTDARAAYWYGAEIRECVVDRDTKLGHLPDNHPDAKLGALDPSNPESYRGMPKVVLKDLIPHGMFQHELVEMIKGWQRNGLVLLAGSNHEYFLNPDDDPNYSALGG